MQEIFAEIADSSVDFFNSPFGFVPVFAELFLSTHFALCFAQADFMFFEAAIAQGGEAGDSHVGTHGVGGCWNGWFDFTLSLDAGKPLAARLTDDEVFDHAENIPAVAIAHPAQLRKLDAAVALVDLEALGKPETVASAAFFKEVFERSLGIFQRLLQGLRERFFEPGKLFFPRGQAICHIDIAPEKLPKASPAS